MTIEEKAKELASYYAGETDYKKEAAYSAAMAMAEFKDEQFESEKQAFIEKVCKWMEISVCDYMTDDGVWGFRRDEMLNDFRKEIVDFDVD